MSAVLVHVLEEVSMPKKTRWVRKDGCTLADHMLFLVSKNSFAVDASLVGRHEGCAYFICHNDGRRSPCMRYGLLRYNLVVDKAKFIERVPLGWDGNKCTWLVPQLAIAQLKEKAFSCSTSQIYHLHNTTFH